MYNKLKYIKLFEQYINSDIDPFGEEDWEIDNLPPVLQAVRRQNNKPYDQITDLYCHNNQLTSLEGIENLVNLERLNCSNNQLINLDGIENLVNLEKLYCSYNQLTSLEGIENLVNLERLYCYNNQLTSLEGIENLVNLKELDCQNNLLKKDYKEYIINYCERNKIRLNV
jgi:hypothetical protein